MRQITIIKRNLLTVHNKIFEVYNNRKKRKNDQFENFILLGKSTNL